MPTKSSEHTRTAISPASSQRDHALRMISLLASWTVVHCVEPLCLNIKASLSNRKSLSIKPQRTHYSTPSKKPQPAQSLKPQALSLEFSAKGCPEETEAKGMRRWVFAPETLREQLIFTLQERERERERLQRAAVGLRAKEDLGVRYEFGSRVLGCMVSGDFHTCCPARALPTLLHLMWDKKV